MSFKNQLCIDNRCDTPGGCYHRGKAGTYCDFSTEKKLCKMLNLIWNPGLELDTLLSLVQDKIHQIVLDTALPSLTVEKEPE